jgi:response regulator NasT
MSPQSASAVLIEEPLRVLIANEEADHLPVIARVVTGLGHVIVAAEIDPDDIGGATRRELADVALVGLGESSGHALELISRIVHEAACPVIALIHDSQPGFVNEAAKRGVFAYVTDDDPQTLQSTLEIVLRRFAEYHSLEGAFARRATIERAKGILMAIHGIDEQQAFDLLRSHSQHTGRKLVDLAEAITHSHRLLVPREPSA